MFLWWVVCWVVWLCGVGCVWVVVGVLEWWGGGGGVVVVVGGGGVEGGGGGGGGAGGVVVGGGVVVVLVVDGDGGGGGGGDGGGMGGVLVGCVAATYNRGMGFGQVPTSLTAMVDAAIGGNSLLLNRLYESRSS